MTLQTQTTRMELHLELRRVLGLLETHFNAQRETEERASENQLLGLAIDADMDGRVLTEALRPEALAARPVATADVAYAVAGNGFRYSAEDEARIQDMLEGLGYV